MLSVTIKYKFQGGLHIHKSRSGRRVRSTRTEERATQNEWGRIKEGEVETSVAAAAEEAAIAASLCQSQIRLADTEGENNREMAL